MIPLSGFHCTKFNSNKPKQLQNSIDDHAPVFLATSHPHVDEDGTVWNIGTAHHKKSGFVYSVFKFQPKSSDEGKKNNKKKTIQRLNSHKKLFFERLILVVLEIS